MLEHLRTFTKFLENKSRAIIRKVILQKKKQFLSETISLCLDAVLFVIKHFFTCDLYLGQFIVHLGRCRHA